MPARHVHLESSCSIQEDPCLREGAFALPLAIKLGTGTLPAMRACACSVCSPKSLCVCACVCVCVYSYYRIDNCLILVSLDDELSTMDPE